MKEKEVNMVLLIFNQNVNSLLKGIRSSPTNISWLPSLYCGSEAKYVLNSEKKKNLLKRIRICSFWELSVSNCSAFHQSRNTPYSWSFQNYNYYSLSVLLGFLIL